MTVTEQDAIRVACTLGKKLGLRVDQPVILASGYALRVHLAPSPVVARVPATTKLVRDPIRPWLEREVEAVAWLAKQGAPVVGPTTLVDPGPHDIEGNTVSLWQLVELDPDTKPSQADFGRMLGELHACLRDYPGELPVLAPPRNDISKALRLIESGGLLERDTIAGLWRAYERFTSVLSDAPLPSHQPVHGDAHPGNLLATRKGFLWNDFEDVCRGPIAWDFASLLIEEAALRAYPSPPGEKERSVFRELRKLQVVTWLVALPFDFEGRATFVADLLAHFVGEQARDGNGG